MKNEETIVTGGDLLLPCPPVFGPDKKPLIYVLDEVTVS